MKRIYKLSTIGGAVRFANTIREIKIFLYYLFRFGLLILFLWGIICLGKVP